MEHTNKKQIIYLLKHINKNLKMIPTAEDLLNKYRFKAGQHIGNSDYDLMAQYAIEFAKLHVQEALKAAHRNMQLPDEDLEFTLDSYSLENIK